MSDSGLFEYEPYSDPEIEAIVQYPVCVERESAWIDEIDPTLREEQAALPTSEVRRQLGLDPENN